MINLNSIGIDTIIETAGAALGLCAMLTAFALWRVNRHARVRIAAVEANLAAMRRELELMASISVKTGHRVKRIEHEYSGVADRVELVELRGPAQSFDRAIDSARRGADPGSLSQQFGLSRGEADLVTRLHGRKTA